MVVSNRAIRVKVRRVADQLITPEETFGGVMADRHAGIVDACNRFPAVCAVPVAFKVRNDGVVGDRAVKRRVDADTMRVWKGTQHPAEAFEVLTYLIGGPGIEGLVLTGAYSGLTAIEAYQQQYFDGLKTNYPFLTQESIDVFVAGLAYPDSPSAEQYQPNWNEAWAREQTFFDLLQNTPPDQLDFDAEWQKLVDDVNAIYAK